MTGKEQDSGDSVVNLADTVIIDHQSVVPYYFQLYQYMTRKIRAGEWPPGHKLPSEKELCDLLGVSRTVVRRALSDLAADGLINTYRAKGSFVANVKTGWQLMQTMGGFYDDATRHGKKVITKVLQLDLIPATGVVAEKLQLAEQEYVVRLRRLRHVDGEPVVVAVTHLPAQLTPGLVNEDFREASLYDLLARKYGLVLAGGIRTIESVNASEEEAKLLKVPVGAALSKLTSVGYLKDGTPLEYFVAFHRGDRSKFEVRLFNPDS